MGASGTLLLAETAEPFDFIEYQLRLGRRFRFLALTGMTDRVGHPVDGANPGGSRFLSAHRLLWEITPDVALGLSEGARYQADQPGLLYLSGIVPYTLVERLEMQDAVRDSARAFQRNNVLWSLDLSWRVHPGLLIYGEILADDIATKDAEMPTRGGFQLGLTHAPRWRGWDWTLGAEYTRVSDYTYSVYYQDQCLCDWEHRGRPLGYDAGPDVEAWLLRAGVAPDARWAAMSWAGHARKGAGTIGVPWVPEAVCACENADTSPDAWSLSGAARIWRVGCEGRYRPRAWIWMGAAFEQVWVRNALEAEGASAPATSGEDRASGWSRETRGRLLLSLGF